MPREPLPTWTFALVVVRLGPRFLLVHERKHGSTWYLPAGAVEPGETPAEAAIRETQEEAGIPIVLDGILRIDYTPRPGGQARLRVIFHAHPADDTPPKAKPDEQTLGAGGFLPAELRSLRLRGDEVRALLLDVERGAPVYPLTLLGPEDRPDSPTSPRAASVGRDGAGSGRTW